MIRSEGSIKLLRAGEEVRSLDDTRYVSEIDISR
jgi:hypothetical protein